MSKYVQFVEEGVNGTIWDNLQHQVFLGDNNFVEKYQPLQNERFGRDATETAPKQSVDFATIPSTINMP
jgi:putative transposase